MKFNKSKTTSNSVFNISRNTTAKKAGINNLSITTKSGDWRVTDTTVRMTLRDARALKQFLNENLTD